MMKSAGFIHLHNHSEYSLLDGMLRITDGEGKPSDFLKGLADKKVPALAFGGTSVLIVVGVALDTLQQVESHLLMRHYEGFVKRSRIRGRQRM